MSNQNYVQHINKRVIYHLIVLDKALKMMYEESLNLPAEPLEVERFMREQILNVYKR